MISIRDFIQHLLDLKPQKDSARLSLYNYIKNFSVLEDQLKPQLFKDFYGNAFQFSYWQQNRDRLKTLLSSDMMGFSQVNNMPPDLASLFERSHEHQYLNLENTSDLYTLFNELSLNRGELRISKISPNRFLTILKTEKKEIRLRVFSSLVRIEDAQLYLVDPLTDLLYGQDLELKPGRLHRIEMTPLSFCEFEIKQGFLNGALYNGYLLEKQAGIHKSLDQLPEIFFAIKALEAKFVNLDSDPFYRELVAQLEKAMEVSKMGTPQALEYANKALHRGKMLQKRVFAEDRLLRLLVSNLEYRLNNKAAVEPAQEDYQKCLDQEIKPRANNRLKIDLIP